MPKTFPNLPGKVWWAIRDKFAASVPSTVSIGYLQSLLGISEKSAKTYLPELKLIGLVSEDGKPTPEALDWRIDSEYERVCSQFVSKIYPDEMQDLFPGPTIDRAKCGEWFTRTLAIGTSAGNQYAATYALLKMPLGTAKSNNEKVDSRPRVRRTSVNGEGSKEKSVGGDAPVSPTPNPSPDVISKPRDVLSPALSVNIQIHIAADAPDEQIEAIFRNMKTYLMNRDR